MNRSVSQITNSTGTLNSRNDKRFVLMVDKKFISGHTSNFLCSDLMNHVSCIWLGDMNASSLKPILMPPITAFLGTVNPE